MMSQKRRERLWGLVLVIWILVAVFALGILDLEPQIRPAGNWEPSPIGQVFGAIVLFLIAMKYLVVKK